MKYTYLGITIALFGVTSVNAESGTGTGQPTTTQILFVTLENGNGTGQTAEHNTGTGQTAEHSNGTGLSLSLSSDARLILSLSDGQTLVQGSAPLQQDYSQLNLDAFQLSNGQVQAAWGQAEVILGCGHVDVLIHDAAQGEVLVQRFGSEYCVQP